MRPRPGRGRAELGADLGPVLPGAIRGACRLGLRGGVLLGQLGQPGVTGGDVGVERLQFALAAGMGLGTRREGGGVRFELAGVGRRMAGGGGEGREVGDQGGLR